MSANATPSPITPRRFWLLRYSLRAMMLLVTLLCLTAALLMQEVNREREVARQAKIIEDMRGECVFADRRPSAVRWLLQRIWPVRLEHLEHDLLMAAFREQKVDLARLRQTPCVQGVFFKKCDFETSEEPEELRLPRVEYLRVENSLDGGRGNVDPADWSRLLECFPNLRKAHLIAAPRNQAFIEALAKCNQLEELKVCFSSTCIELVDTTCLASLKHLRSLRIAGTTNDGWKWDSSFIGQLEELEDLELGNNEDLMASVRGPFSWEQVAYVTDYFPWRKLRNLRRAGIGDWKDLAANNDLRAVRVSWIDAKHELNELKRERLACVEGLRLLPRGEGDSLEALEAFPDLVELEITIGCLDDDSLLRLSKLHTLKRIRLSFDPFCCQLTPEGISLFKTLPIVELKHGVPPALLAASPVSSCMQEIFDDWNSRTSPVKVTDEGIEFLLRAKQGRH